MLPPKIISLTLLIAKVSPRKKVVLEGEIRDLSMTITSTFTTLNSTLNSGLDAFSFFSH